MRILVTGGRSFDDRIALFAALDRLHTLHHFTLLMHAAAKGADRLAGEWALERGVPIDARTADWKRYGRATGPIRNHQMLEEMPDLVIAFPGGKGTRDMVNRARQAGISVIIVE